MDTPTTGGPCANNGGPQAPARGKTKARTPQTSATTAKKPVQWCNSMYRMPPGAQNMTGLNAQKKGVQHAAPAMPPRGPPLAAAPMQTDAPSQNADNETGTPIPKRKHDALLTNLPNLPDGFVKGTDTIGATHKKESGRPERPLVDIVSFGPKEDIFSSVTVHPAGDDGKKISFGNKYTPAQKMRARDYSRVHGYDSEKGDFALPPRGAR